MKKLLNDPTVGQFFRFSLVGASNTFLDFGTYFSLTRGTDFFGSHLLIANGLAWLIAACWSYNLNRRWTYQSGETKVAAEFSRFLLVSLSILLISESLLYVFAYKLGLYDLTAKFLILGFTIFASFLGQKFLVFGNLPKISKKVKLSVANSELN